MIVLRFARKSVLAEIRADIMALEARESRVTSGGSVPGAMDAGGCFDGQGTGCTALPMKFKVGAPCDDASE